MRYSQVLTRDEIIAKIEAKYKKNGGRSYNETKEEED